jgi:hypothetical protein
MSDLHRLPLLEHDLPEYRRNDDTSGWGKKREKVKVYRNEDHRWSWEHLCKEPTPTTAGRIVRDPTMWGFILWRDAYRMANMHAKECCR